MRKILLTGLVLMMSGALTACATDMPEPKYPIYMERKTEASAPEPAQESVAETTAVESVNGQGSQGAIVTADLPPPPPPPPPEMEAPKPAMVAEAKPVPAAQPSVAKTAPATTAPKTDGEGYLVYTVAGSDTAYGISRRFGVPVKTILDMNGLGDGSSLSVGQKIKLPVSAKDKGVEAHANGAAPVLGSKPTSVAAKPESVKTEPVKPEPAKTAPVKPETPKPEAKNQVAEKPKTDAPVQTPQPKPVVTTPPATTPPAPKTTKPVAPPANGAFPTTAQLKAMSKGMFDWPLKGKILFPFGQLKPNVKNDGINIGAARGTDIRAAGDGMVVYAGNQVKALGNTIYIKHENGWYTGYSHLQDMKVKNNQMVKKGDIIGTVGAPTDSDPGQLHFEVRYTPNADVAKPIDPTIVLP